MRFETPAGQVAFEIPDGWWFFTEMDNFSLEGHRFYAYPLHARSVDVVPLSDVEPPMRNSGVPPFKKYKMVPILFALSSPECALPLSRSTLWRHRPHIGSESTMDITGTMHRSQRVIPCCLS